MENRYGLTNHTIVHRGKTLYQICSLKDQLYAKAGQLGGYIESEDNLPQDGTGWVLDDAKVYGQAVIHDGSQIRHLAEVYGQAQVYGSYVGGEALVWDDAQIRESSVLDSWILKDAVIDNSMVHAGSVVTGDSSVKESVVVDGSIVESGDYFGAIIQGSHLANQVAYGCRYDHCERRDKEEHNGGVVYGSAPILTPEQYLKLNQPVSKEMLKSKISGS